MSGVTPIVLVGGLLLGVAVLTVVAWFLYTVYLDRVERRLANRKGLYRELVAELATRDRALLDPTIHQIRTLYDLDAFEAVLEEQARSATERPAWLLEVYDRLGLIDKYIDKLQNARKWRDRAFAAELLGRVGNAKAVPALLQTVQATQTEDADVREIALRALARIADPGAIEPLVAALENADAWLAPRIADILVRHGALAIEPLIQLLSGTDRDTARAWAANVLGEVRAVEAVPLLLQALEDPSDEVRSKAATALGRLRDRRAVAPLLEHLLIDPAPFVRARVASALAQFGGPEVTERLVRTLGDSAWWVRMRGVEALEQIGQGAEAALLMALDDSDPEIRQRAAVSLERLGMPAQLTVAIEQGGLGSDAARTLSRMVAVGTRELVSQLLLHPSNTVRQVVIAGIRDARRRDVSGELIRIGSGDPAGAVQALALDTLRVLRIREAVPAALAALRAEDTAVQVAALRLLAQLGARDAITAVRSQSGHPAPEVRAAAAEALGSLGGPGVEAEILHLVGDPERSVRRAALSGATHAGFSIPEPILSQLLQDVDPAVQRAAVRAAEQSGDPVMVSRLTEAFSSANPELRSSIILALSRIQPAAVSDLLNQLTANQDTASRLALARTLERMRWPGAADQLVRLAADPDAGVRWAAIQALSHLPAEGPLPDAAQQVLDAALADSMTSVRAAAADACGRMRLPQYGRTLLRLVERDPAPEVRERAALAIGLLRTQGGEEVLMAACRRPEPPEVRAAAALAAGAFNRGSLVGLILEMPDEASVRQVLRDRLKHDAWFRLLSRKLPRASDVEIRSLAAEPGAEEASLSIGMERILDAGERVRIISGLRAFQGEDSRVTLLQSVRTDPSPEVRTAALTSVAELLDPDELLDFGSRALGDPSPMVRRTAIGLFARVPPERALPRLIHSLRLDEDVIVLAAAGSLAEQHFEAYRAAVLTVALEDRRAALVARLSRYVHHPDLTGVLGFIARSGNPEVRQTVGEVWCQRPESAEPVALEALIADPVISVRLTASAAAAAAERYDLLDRLRQDPDPSVRREIAVVLGRFGQTRGGGEVVLRNLESDSEMIVRAAAHVALLLIGIPVPLPPGLEPSVAAEAVRDTGELESLREIARTAPSEERRLAAGLALALVQDEAAKEIAHTDPAPSIRHRVAGALELALPEDARELR